MDPDVIDRTSTRRLERRRERCLVDTRAARRVDQHAGRLDEREPPRPLVERSLSKRLFRHYLGFATSQFDVAVISLGFVSFIAAGRPIIASNSLVHYTMYFVALAGTDKPALSSESKQLCVEGLKHGERYNINLRAGLPSSVKESLPKSAEFNIYVRDRKPFVRFTGKAYVLPSRGQQGIPVVTTNTNKINVEVFRLGDRALAATLQSGDMQRQLSSYDVDNIRDRTGIKVYTGTMDIAAKLNEEVTTAVPVTDATGRLEPGVYVMVATPTEKSKNESYERATQWFIVSDLGLTAI